MNPYHARTSYQDRQVASGYDAERFTSLLGRLYNRRELRALDAVLRWVKPGSRVLDLACGTGRITEQLVARGLDVTGVDISMPMIEHARNKLRGAGSFVVGDAEVFPFRDASFDWVVSVRLFGHLPPPVRARALAEVTRVARCGAIIAFYLLNPVTRTRRFAKSLLRCNPHWYPAANRQIVCELESQGLTVREICAVIPVVDQAHLFVCHHIGQSSRRFGAAQSESAVGLSTFAPAPAKAFVSSACDGCGTNMGVR
jgi:ubiquinone/menaquinone biosynthesis C-methylase UbiE